MLFVKPENRKNKWLEEKKLMCCGPHSQGDSKFEGNGHSQTTQGSRCFRRLMHHKVTCTYTMPFIAALRSAMFQAGGGLSSVSCQERNGAVLGESWEALTDVYESHDDLVCLLLCSALKGFSSVHALHVRNPKDPITGHQYWLPLLMQA